METLLCMRLHQPTSFHVQLFRAGFQVLDYYTHPFISFDARGLQKDSAVAIFTSDAAPGEKTGRPHVAGFLQILPALCLKRVAIKAARMAPLMMLVRLLISHFPCMGRLNAVHR